MKSMKKILIVAGETSGDAHGGRLVNELLSLNSQLSFLGIAGPKMREAGVKDIYRTEDFSFMGIKELLGHYFFMKKAIKDINSEIDKGVNLVILIDYPDFNFRIAKYAKSVGVPVFYYIAPQVWAWRKKRAFAMSKFVDKLAVIFDFEEEVFKSSGVNVSFVGHPLLEKKRKNISKKEFCDKINASKEDLIIGLLPGSRKQEIEYLLPVMLDACEIMFKNKPNSSFVVSHAPGISLDLIKNEVQKHEKLPVKIFSNVNDDIINNSDAVLVASGTATLETALAVTPMVVLYKTSALTYALIKPLINLENICIVNILAKKRIVPELLQKEMTPQNTATELLRVLDNKDILDTMKKELLKVKEHLGFNGASKRAASLALELIKGDN